MRVCMCAFVVRPKSAPPLTPQSEPAAGDAAGGTNLILPGYLISVVRITSSRYSPPPPNELLLLLLLLLTSLPL